MPAELARDHLLSQALLARKKVVYWVHDHFCVNISACAKKKCRGAAHPTLLGANWNVYGMPGGLQSRMVISARISSYVRKNEMPQAMRLFS